MRGRAFALASWALVIASLVTAQTTMLNSFAASRSLVAPLLASISIAAAYPCAAPPTLSTGYWSRTNAGWLGQLWGNNTGGTWNTVVQSYAVCLGTTNDYLRFELHDTQYDHGLTDPSIKRRAEIETNGKYVNNVEYWMAYGIRVHVNNLRQGLSIRGMQVHWFSGASPAVGDTIIYQNGHAAFRVTIKNDSVENLNVGTVPMTLDTAHDVVTHFRLGGAGSFEDTYLDGKLVSHFTGRVGSLKGNGYKQRYGSYGQIPGMSTVVEYRNMNYLGTADLSGRIVRPPAF